MTSRDRNVLIIVVAAVLIIGSWLLLIQPKRSQASKLGSQVTAARSQLTAADAQITAGQAAKRSYASLYTSLARLGEAVPGDDDVPSLIYQLQSAANTTKVDFQNFVLSTSSSSSVPTSTATGIGSTAPLPPGVTVGPAGLPIEPFTLTFDGNYFHLASFLGRIQHFVSSSNNTIHVRGRLMTLNAISIGPGPRGFPQIAVSINATTYLAPNSGVLGGGTTTGPPSSDSTAVSGSSSSSSSDFPTAAITSTAP